MQYRRIGTGSRTGRPQHFRRDTGASSPLTIPAAAAAPGKVLLLSSTLLFAITMIMAVTVAYGLFGPAGAIGSSRRVNVHSLTDPSTDKRPLFSRL